MEVIVVEVSGIKDGISEIAKGRAVPIVRARLGDNIDLSASLSAVLRVIQSTVDPILFDRVLRNLQAGL